MYNHQQRRTYTHTLHIDNKSQEIKSPGVTMEVAGYLPVHLLQNIFLRLDVESLISLTIICKSWYGFIYSPSFIKTHLSHHSLNPKNHHLLLLRPGDNAITLSPLDLSGTPSISKTLVPVYKDPPTDFGLRNMPPARGTYRALAIRESKLSLVGCVNGLVCIRSPSYRPTHLIIWNPATRRVKHIDLFRVDDEFQIYMAFVYDSVTDDYKIVCIYRIHQEFRDDVICRFFMFSCNDESLLELKTDDASKFSFHGCAIVDGNPHWMAMREEDPICLCVDVRSKAIRMFPRPQFDRNASTKTSVTNVADSFALVLYSPGTEPNDAIHVYTVDKNLCVWTRRYTIEPIGLQQPLSVQFYRDDKFVIMDNQGKLFMYDLITKEIKDMGLGEGVPALNTAINYSESLVGIVGMESTGEEAGQETAITKRNRSALNGSDVKKIKKR